MPDGKDPAKVIPLFKQDGKVTIEQALWEIYNAIYALTFATDLDGIEKEDSEIQKSRTNYRDLIFCMKEIRRYSEKVSFALFELVKKHPLDDSQRSKQDDRE